MRTTLSVGRIGIYFRCCSKRSLCFQNIWSWNHYVSLYANNRYKYFLNENKLNLLTFSERLYFITSFVLYSFQQGVLATGLKKLFRLLIDTTVRRDTCANKFGSKWKNKIHIPFASSFQFLFFSWNMKIRLHGTSLFEVSHLKFELRVPHLPSAYRNAWNKSVRFVEEHVWYRFNS